MFQNVGGKKVQRQQFFCTGVVGFPYHKPAAAASAPADVSRADCSGLRLSCPCSRVCVNVCLKVLYGDRVVCESPKRGGRQRWCVQVDNHSVVFSSVKNKSSLSHRPLNLSLFLKHRCVEIPSCLCSTVLHLPQLTLEPVGLVVKDTIPEQATQFIYISSSAFLYIVEVLNRCIFRLVCNRCLDLSDFIKLSDISGQCDRNCQAQLEIDLSIFLKEDFDDFRVRLLRQQDPPPQKISMMVPSSPDPQVHCHHLGLFFCSKQRNVIIVVW